MKQKPGGRTTRNTRTKKKKKMLQSARWCEKKKNTKTRGKRKGKTVKRDQATT